MNRVLYTTRRLLIPLLICSAVYIIGLHALSSASHQMGWRKIDPTNSRESYIQRWRGIFLRDKVCYFGSFYWLEFPPDPTMVTAPYTMQRGWISAGQWADEDHGAWGYGLEVDASVVLFCISAILFMVLALRNLSFICSHAVGFPVLTSSAHGVERPACVKGV